MKKLIFLLVVSLGNSLLAQSPLPNAHAHNDYEHDRPLLEALEQGFISVEVDIHAIDGQLYVSHFKPLNLAKTPTLEELYLKPLAQYIQANEGQVYTQYDGYFYLMIDLKTDAEVSFPLLVELLKQYETMLSVVRDQVDEPTKPVKVFISGSRGAPYEYVLADSIQYAAIDGRPGELSLDIPSACMPVVSDNYKHFLSWRGKGEVDPDELAEIEAMIAHAHQQGKKVRLWAAPDKPVVWEFLLSIGVDLINTDRLSDFQEFMSERE